MAAAAEIFVLLASCVVRDFDWLAKDFSWGANYLGTIAFQFTIGVVYRKEIYSCEAELDF